MQGNAGGTVEPGRHLDVLIMDKVLFVNACVRPDSRTLELAEALLAKPEGDLQQVRLQEMSLPAPGIFGADTDGILGKAKAEIAGAD